MKTATVLVILLTATLMLGTTHTAPTKPASTSPVAALLAGVGYHANIVRVEYYYSEPRNRQASTVCHIKNTSAIEPVVLKELVLLGADGASSILTTYTGLVDRVVPPLGEIDLSIGSNIPGLAVGNASAPGVRNVVLIWAGSSEALRLNAAIDSREPGSAYTRILEVADGYEVHF